MILEDADAGELMEKLLWFDRLESILLTGSVPEQSDLQQLQKQYPDIFFLWKMDALGMTLETDITSLFIRIIGKRRTVESHHGFLP